MSKTQIPRNCLHITSFPQIEAAKEVLSKSGMKVIRRNGMLTLLQHDMIDLCRLHQIMKVHQWNGARKLTIIIDGKEDTTSIGYLRSMIRSRSFKLQQLEIKFKNGVAYQDLEDLHLQILRHAANLHLLQISFKCFIQRGCIDSGDPYRFRGHLKDEGLLMFGKEFKKALSSLRAIRLYFEDVNLSPEGIEGLSEIGRYVKLNSIAIEFKHCSTISDDGLNVLAKKFIRNLVGLTQLKLAFIKDFILRDSRTNELTDELVERLRTSRWHYQRPNDISFGLEQLLSSITKNLTNLEHFNLNLPGHTDFSLGRAISLANKDSQSLAKLQSLVLNLSDCYTIQDTCLEALDLWIRKHTSQLSFLRLDFSWCYKIKNQGFLNLFSGDLRHFNKLSSLILNFTGCQFITDEAVVGLFTNASEQLTKLTKLAFISPKFWSYSAPVPNLSCTSFLLVNLANCLEISDSSLMAIEPWLNKYLTRLQNQLDKQEDSVINPQNQVPIKALATLILNFSKCKKLTEERINQIVGMLKSSYHLFGTIQLDFNESKIIDKEN